MGFALGLLQVAMEQGYVGAIKGSLWALKTTA
jgi:hypothetical protein